MNIYAEIEYVPIGEVKPYWNNPRINDQTKIALVDAFKKIGFNQPILIDTDGVIVKGHARFYAAKMSGFEKVPCIVSVATEAQNREDRILDNRIQEQSVWDTETLMRELTDLDVILEGVDFDLNKEIAQQVAEMPGYEPQEVSKPALVHVCPGCSRRRVYTSAELQGGSNE